MTTKLLHGERKTGSWRRCFSLPIDCDMKTLRAGLEAGLLHISIFKRDMAGGEPATKIEVE
jgi:HSP20 family molecular chaperone IbpA